ncbi:hypothetical protein DY000_02031221 [Brassica cretica]|uniref:Uncharacterized protein n=1 Tax=Brassica cretica TaxID=69181 RepID=A0ABQ7DMA5_BRACR|nr:hypothetical protein DY000_02031221 [Brassica cretica]
MGGRSSVEEGVLCQFTFPERPGFSFVGDIDTSAPFESVRERIFARRPKISLLYAIKQRRKHVLRLVKLCVRSNGQGARSKMCLVAARKMKEAARAAETVAITEIQDVTRRRRTRETLQEEILEKIEKTAQEIRSSRRIIEEGLERVNSAKMEAEEEEEEKQWQWSERRRRSSSTYKGKYTNRRETVLMDVNGLDMMMNGDGTASSVAVLKPAMMINGRVSLGQIL